MGLDHNDNNKELARTPVAPKLGNKTQSIFNTNLMNRSNKTPNQFSAKTPLQTSYQNPYLQRGFKTDVQQNRNPNRFAETGESNNNVKQYPSTSFKNRTILERLNPQSAKKENATKKNALIIQKMTNLFGQKTAKKSQPQTQSIYQSHYKPKQDPQKSQVQQQQSQQQPKQEQRQQHQHQERHLPQLVHNHHHDQQTPQLNHIHQSVQEEPPAQQQPSYIQPLQQHRSQHQNHQVQHQQQDKQEHLTHLSKTPVAYPISTGLQVEPKTGNRVPPTATKTIHSTSAVNSNAKYNIQVNNKLYKVLRKLGAGGSAKVYEALEPKTTNSVAIKIIGLSDESTRESYFKELSILSKLKDNRHVVHMIDSEHKVHLDELVIVMEKGDGDLAQVIEDHFKTRKNTYMDGIFIKYYWQGMVRAVNEIHKHGIVHADLKPVNFIIKRNEIKLIDFGIADAVQPDYTSIIRDFQIGTINYMAPESLRNRALDASFIAQNPPSSEDGDQLYKKTVIKYNCKADIWSLGCILYNLVYGRPPFDKFQDFPSKMQAIIDKDYKIDFPLISHQKLLDCMKLCLRYNFKERPSADELLRHPYLSEDLIALLPSIGK